MPYTVRKGRSVHRAAHKDPKDPKSPTVKTVFQQGDEVPGLAKEEAERLVRLGFVVESRSEEAKAAREAVGTIPATFPGHDALGQAGVTTFDAIESMSDDEILAIEGIGPKTLHEIRQAQK